MNLYEKCIFSKGYIDFPDADNKKKRIKLDSEDKVAFKYKIFISLFLINIFKKIFHHK